MNPLRRELTSACAANETRVSDDLGMRSPAVLELCSPSSYIAGIRTLHYRLILYKRLLPAVEVIVSMVVGRNRAYSHVQGPVRGRLERCGSLRTVAGRSPRA
jgi:hypothetical protein